MTNSATIVANWPDALMCGAGAQTGSVFIIHGASSSPGAISWYRQIYSPEDRFVTFKSDGTYNSRGGYDGSSKGCEGMSIQQLHDSGRTFNFATSKIQDTPGSSIVANWPDALMCGAGAQTGSVFIIHGASSSPGAVSWYRQIYSPEDRFITFNSDGAYRSRGGYDGSSKGCEGMSIQQLYSAGRAFNFVKHTLTTTITQSQTPSSTLTKSTSLVPVIVPQPSMCAGEDDCVVNYAINGNIKDAASDCNKITYCAGNENNDFSIRSRETVIIGFKPHEDKVDLSTFHCLQYNDLGFRSHKNDMMVSFSDKISFSIVLTNITSALSERDFIFDECSPNAPQVHVESEGSNNALFGLFGLFGLLLPIGGFIAWKMHKKMATGTNDPVEPVVVGTVLEMKEIE